MENHILKYHRNRKGTPRGVVVATENGIGWSLCRKTDRFSKRTGVNIAFDRANNPESKRLAIPSSLTKEFLNMEGRRKHYFKLED